MPTYNGQVCRHLKSIFAELEKHHKLFGYFPSYLHDFMTSLWCYMVISGQLITKCRRRSAKVSKVLLQLVSMWVITHALNMAVNLISADGVIYDT